MSSKSQATLIRVHRLLPLTEAEGPGRRACLWVQGCALACPGCFNQETWDFKAGTLTPVEDVFRSIRQQAEIEGVTFVGGEPFAQATPLARLGEMCRDAGLSVVTFSGYKYAHLKHPARPHAEYPGAGILAEATARRGVSPAGRHLRCHQRSRHHFEEHT